MKELVNGTNESIYFLVEAFKDEEDDPDTILSKPLRKLE
jgi:hypothetical protein